MQSTFGEFLRQKRQEKKLTQKDLAKLLIVSESAVSKWERDVARPDIALLPKLSEILGASEHELITASVDNQARTEKLQAKKWRIVSLSWSLFFYIAYAVALIPCFICNLAIDKTLSWFWIVVSALTLSFTFTNLPKLIKKHKLIFLPLANYLALCLLLGVCAIYTKGEWFGIAALSVLLGLSILFTPIYICKYGSCSKIRKYADFLSVAVNFLLLNILLIVIDIYSVVNGYVSRHWYFTTGFPIVSAIYLIINLLLSVRFLRINRLFKTGVILGLINFFLYILPLGIQVKSSTLQKELDGVNVFKADFSNWQSDISLQRNIHCIIFLTLLALAILFLIAGCIRRLKSKKQR